MTMNQNENDDNDKVTITTPLYYANAAPHMGSAYPTMAADALSRFYRMCGKDVKMITGVDEHGEKVSEASGDVDTLEFCDGISGLFVELWNKLDVDVGVFVRTSGDVHREVVEEMWRRVEEKGDVYRGVYKGFYCLGCEEYKDVEDLSRGNFCKVHLKECKEREEENWFFRLSKYQERLEGFLEENKEFIRPVERRNEVMSWVRAGLKDFSISRANVKWGIPVPGDPEQTIYVWFDALIGYLSALSDLESKMDSVEGNGSEVNKNVLDSIVAGGRWPPLVQIIGKDILRFHAVYWPAMLMSADIALPKSLYGHGFLTKDGLKMGKSLGNTVEPIQLVETYGSDAVRYYFLRGIDFGSDGDFSMTRFINVVNADLANSLGNLLSRSLQLLAKYCDETVPYSSEEIAEDRYIKRLVTDCFAAKKHAYAAYRNLDFMKASEAVVSVANLANIHFDRAAPWKGFKGDEDEVTSARKCVTAMLECVRITAAGLAPITPRLTRSIYEALGRSFVEDGCWDEEMKWGGLKKGERVVKGEAVFMRMESADEKKKKGGQTPKKSKKGKKSQVSVQVSAQ